MKSKNRKEENEIQSKYRTVDNEMESNHRKKEKEDHREKLTVVEKLNDSHI